MPQVSGLFTDRYEFSMAESFLANGLGDRQAVFEVFARTLPKGRRYGMVAGLGRLISMIETYRPDTARLDWMSSEGIISPATASWLGDYRFTGSIDAYPEGELYFPGSPVLTVTGPLAECLVLETLTLSVLNHDSAVASAAARMVTAAEGRPLIEMGSRRTQEASAVAAARAAFLAGFDTTSNLEAGFRHAIPTAGTAAHAFILAHDDERTAFAHQVAAHGAGTTLLVDTYDIEAGIRTAVDVAGPQLGGIRIDSGTLSDEAAKARVLLDQLGATGTKIVVTSDLDEYLITALRDDPVDTYGVGTRVVTGSGHPTASMVFKLVAIADSGAPDAPLRPVAKASSGKQSQGGRKRSWREHVDGHLAHEWYAVDAPDAATQLPPDADAVQVPVITNGVVQPQPSIEEARKHAAMALQRLPPAARQVTDGSPYLQAELKTESHGTTSRPGVGRKE